MNVKQATVAGVIAAGINLLIALDQMLGFYWLGSMYQLLMLASAAGLLAFFVVLFMKQREAEGGAQ